MRTFVVAGQDRHGGGDKLAGGLVDMLFRYEGHALDTEISVTGPNRRIAKWRAVTEELHEPLGGQNTDPVPDRKLAAKAAFVLELLGKLGDGKQPPGRRLIKQHAQDHIMTGMVVLEMAAELIELYERKQDKPCKEEK